MKIITKSKNLKITPDLQKFIEEKIGGLKKFTDILKKEEGWQKTLAEVFVEVGKETMHHRKGDIFAADAVIFLPGKKIIATSRGDDPMNVIVELKDKLQQELKKYKVKSAESRRRLQKKSRDDPKLDNVF